MTNRSSNTAAVPEAKGALDRFKFEVASELGVPLLSLIHIFVSGANSKGKNGRIQNRFCLILYAAQK